MIARLPMVRTPYYQVLLEKLDITPWVSSVSLVEDDQQADNVSITLPDPRMIYSDCLFEGSIVEIDLGYAEPNQHALMLRAIITKVEQTYPDSGVPALTLRGEDRSIMMGLVEKKAVWRNKTVTAIVKEIAGKNKLPKVQATLSPDPMVRKPINQDGKTDLAFLQELAKTYHAKCFIELDEHGDEVLYFLPERRIVTLNRPDTLILQYRMGPGSNLITFSPSFDSSYIDRQKEVSDVDDKGKSVESQKKPPAEIEVWKLNEARMAQASSDDARIINSLYKVGVGRKQELQKALTTSKVSVGEVALDQSDVESRNDVSESRSLGMTATGSTFGNIWLRAKSNVQIQGVNARFSGQWYVSSVTHKIDGGGYKTDFKCVR
jgi:phage protein D